ncbi:hypothetical protein RRG08_034017 [Elysia crispata]|uniref:Uncharacterized protein n=1 Tax=Elysia crispata TaxID=231223 RepID=A0AAE1CMU1_9GAST|nr:hypothetical protein RRG08_034017 [Elysia crispata]
MIDDLRRGDRVAVITDCWTSRSTDSYITVTVLFIGPDWQPKSGVLPAMIHNQRHTAGHLADMIRDI